VPMPRAALVRTGLRLQSGDAGPLAPAWHTVYRGWQLRSGSQLYFIESLHGSW
jgi:hypothetical protein